MGIVYGLDDRKKETLSSEEILYLFTTFFLSCVSAFTTPWRQPLMGTVWNPNVGRTGCSVEDPVGGGRLIYVLVIRRVRYLLIERRDQLELKHKDT